MTTGSPGTNAAPEPGRRYDLTATQLAKRLGISRQQVHVYAKDGMKSRTVNGVLIFDEDECRDWIANNLSPAHGGKRPGAGRPGKSGRPRGAEIVESVHDQPSPGGEQDLDLLVRSTTPEDRAALATKVTVRQALAYHKWVAAMAAEHDLAVKQGKYVPALDAEHAWRRMATEAANRMDEASRRAADEIATRLQLTLEHRAVVEEVFRIELARVRDTLAERKA